MRSDQYMSAYLRGGGRRGGGVSAKTQYGTLPHQHVPEAEPALDVGVRHYAPEVDEDEHVDDVRDGGADDELLKLAAPLGPVVVVHRVHLLHLLQVPLDRKLDGFHDLADPQQLEHLETLEQPQRLRAVGAAAALLRDFSTLEVDRRVDDGEDENLGDREGDEERVEAVERVPEVELGVHADELSRELDEEDEREEVVQNVDDRDVVDVLRLGDLVAVVAVKEEAGGSVAQEVVFPARAVLDRDRQGQGVDDVHFALVAHDAQVGEDHDVNERREGAAQEELLDLLRPLREGLLPLQLGLDLRAGRCG